MALKRKLHEWQRAGLLDASTVERIEAYEESRSRPYALYVIGGIGALAVGLGIISMIAANWADIPRGVKLAVDLAVVAWLARYVFLADRAGKAWAREVALIILQLLVLASVGLIGQTYHLGGKAWQALLAWALMTTPMMLVLGRSHVTAVALLTALNAGALTTLGEWLDRAHLGRFTEELIIACTAGVLPLLHLRLAWASRLREQRPALSQVMEAAGFMVVLCASGAMQHAWYERTSAGDDTVNAVRVSLVAVAGMVALVWVGAARRFEDDAQRLCWRVLLVYAVAAGYLPFLVEHPRLGLLSAVSFLGYLAVIAWYAYRRRQVWLFNLATAVMALRLLGIFIELFGGLLLTGFGLVLGGAAILGMARLWMNQTRQWRATMRTPGGAP
ncbi:MAG: DUF2157 domain-containing protein [Deltaproteobacteria bacterium]|nr:DUF2157 domain-containing protein [Deltaproteobacteria bacterium]